MPILNGQNEQKNRSKCASKKETLNLTFILLFGGLDICCEQFFKYFYCKDSKDTNLRKPQILNLTQR